MSGSARSTPPIEPRRCPGTYTNCGGAVLSRYNPASHCAPCEYRRHLVDPELPIAPRELPPEQREKADEVLSVALTLLRAGEAPAPIGPSAPRAPAAGRPTPPAPYRAQEHGKIAAPFVTRFLVETWGGPLAAEVRELHEYIGRMRRDPGWRHGLPERQEPLTRYGLHLRADAAGLLAPVHGPDTALITALSFGDAMVFPEHLGLTIHVWSALLRKEVLRRALAPALDWWRTVAQNPALHRGAARSLNLRPWDVSGNNRIETRYSEAFCEFRRRAGLPYIKLSILGNSPPTSGRIADWYADVLKLWQHRLWDGRDGRQRQTTPERPTLIRGWALHTLRIHAGLGLDAALEAWNRFARENRRDNIEQGSMTHASEDRKLAQNAAEKLRLMLTPRRKLLPR
jgi:hypothetical protein